mgnify:CR=1 FL=1
MRLVLPLLAVLTACGAPSRWIVSTEAAPQAIGPYSQAVDDGTHVWCAGQIGLDPATGRLVDGGIEAETERALRNLEAILGAAGLKMSDVVKTTVYVIDLSEFGKMNAIYGRSFPSNPPARATVQVAALPKGARVEIEAVARR